MPVDIPGFGSLSDEVLFTIGNIAVIPGWLILVMLPRWSKRHWVIYTGVLVNAFIYALTIFPALNGLGGGLVKAFQDMGTLEGVEDIFRKGGSVILPAWIHYIAQDLVSATYLVETNHKDPAGLHQLFMAPVVLMVYLLGPFGFVAYLILRIISGIVIGNGKAKTS